MRTLTVPFSARISGRPLLLELNPPGAVSEPSANCAGCTPLMSALGSASVHTPSWYVTYHPEVSRRHPDPPRVPPSVDDTVESGTVSSNAHFEFVGMDGAYVTSTSGWPRVGMSAWIRAQTSMSVTAVDTGVFGPLLSLEPPPSSSSSSFFTPPPPPDWTRFTSEKDRASDSIVRRQLRSNATASPHVSSIVAPMSSTSLA